MVSRERIAKAYDESVIQKFPSDITPEKLTHTYNDERTLRGNPINFKGVLESMASLRSDVESWYKSSTGKEMNTYELGSLTNGVKDKFYDDMRFFKAFIDLGLNPVHIKEAYLPWWSELSVGEAGIEELGNGVVHAMFNPMHSYEVQLDRQGFKAPLKGASIDGLVFTAPDKSSSKGHLTLGVRGGTAAFPNTYHVVAAGALKATEEFKKGSQNLTDIFVKDELITEMGEITSNLIDYVKPISRNIDWIVNNGGSTYAFEVRTKLSKEEIRKLWIENKDIDKAEHKELLFIPATQENILDFMQKNYRGVVANKKDRNDSERVLLHCAALDLASYFDINPGQLKELYMEGEW